jgi:outer membrane biosynthesis protein TonB
MRARRTNSAALAIAAPAGVFPGKAMPEPEGGRKRIVSSGLSILLHALLIGALALAAYFAPPEVVEQVIEVTRIRDDTTAEKAPGSPRPRAIAESSGAYAPAPMALQAAIINPTVIQARAANIAAAQQIQVQAMQPVAAPQQIKAATAPVVESVRAYQSIAVATATPVVDTATSAQIAGNVAVQAPVGTVVGPRQVVTNGATVGIGGPTALGTGSSVREGIASNRDVAGGKTGERAGVHWAVGEGGGRGRGGSGTGDGLGGGGGCGGPEISSYMDRMRDRTMARWNTGGLKGQIQIRFRVDPAGSVSNIALVTASPRELGPSGLEAFRAASPFEPMSDRVRCLSTEDLTATFTVD